MATIAADVGSGFPTPIATNNFTSHLQTRERRLQEPFHRREHTSRILCYNTLTMPRRFFRIGLFIVCAALGVTVIARPAMPGQTADAPRNSPAEGRSDTLLVMPFENNSRIPNLDWLGEGLSEIITEHLQDRGLYVLSRPERLTALEKIGLPDSARFSHATIVKIATEADADEVVFGKFVSDGKTVTMEARVFRISPPWLSPPYTQSSSMADLLRAQARLSWRILCALEQKDCPREEANKDESSFTEPPPSLHLEVLENFIRGVTGFEDEVRLRALREAARLEPYWDRPAFELGRIYFARHDCELALPWFSRVPPNRPDGAEASFDAGMCHLLRNDAIRAEAAFSGLLERARSKDPGDQLPELAEFHNNLGIARLNLGKWNEAAAEFERAAALEEEAPDYWMNLGIAKLAEKQLASAVTALERASKLDPQDKSARTLLISALESLGRGSDAAALRAEMAGSGGRPAPTLPQDPAALARQAHVSKNFDRARLRPAPDEFVGPPPRGKDMRKRGDGGGPN